jgi:ubiquinone/menaquinone biosynthesis C-methylase UbiE
MNSESDAVSDSIIEFYQVFDEADRLKRDIGPLEFERTKEVFRRFLPDPPAVVCDIGGGTGPYAFWLAHLGYTVDLLDIVPRHIQQARETQRNLQAGHLRSIQVGDARKLHFRDGHADAVIMHGPLYHHVDVQERLTMLSEAKRILKSTGVLLAVAISRYAGAIAGLITERVWDPTFIEICRREITTGVRRVPDDGKSMSKDRAISTAYFHRPEEFAQEIDSAGFVVNELLGILGPSWMVPDLQSSWRDPNKRSVILNLARMFEGEPAFGPRILAVCRPRA